MERTPVLYLLVCLVMAPIFHGPNPSLIRNSNWWVQEGPAQPGANEHCNAEEGTPFTWAMQVGSSFHARHRLER